MIEVYNDDAADPWKLAIEPLRSRVDCMIAMDGIAGRISLSLRRLTASKQESFLLIGVDISRIGKKVGNGFICKMDY